jgi:hypothetical protein
MFVARCSGFFARLEYTYPMQFERTRPLLSPQTPRRVISRSKVRSAVAAFCRLHSLNFAEHFQLGLEESFFLAHVLKCLQIKALSGVSATVFSAHFWWHQGVLANRVVSRSWP